jgi:hypothetical protein
MARSADPGFALAAAATTGDDPAAPPAARLELFAPSALVPAAALASALAAAILDGRVPAGLSTPREALNPSVLLAELEKRGARISAASG